MFLGPRATRTAAVSSGCSYTRERARAEGGSGSFKVVWCRGCSSVRGRSVACRSSILHLLEALGLTILATELGLSQLGFSGVQDLVLPRSAKVEG